MSLSFRSIAYPNGNVNTFYDILQYKRRKSAIANTSFCIAENFTLVNIFGKKLHPKEIFGV